LGDSYTRLELTRVVVKWSRLAYAAGSANTTLGFLEGAFEVLLWFLAGAFEVLAVL